MTLGLIAGTVVAESAYHRVDFLDPKILLSILMWVVYLLMVLHAVERGVAWPESRDAGECAHL